MKLINRDLFLFYTERRTSDNSGYVPEWSDLHGIMHKFKQAGWPKFRDIMIDIRGELAARGWFMS